MTLDQIIANNLVQVANSKIYLATKNGGSTNPSVITNPTMNNNSAMNNNPTMNNNLNINTVNNTNNNSVILTPPILNCKTQ